MRLCPRSRRSASSSRPAERGYILIILILFVALLAIAMTAFVPVISQQIKRDREEELIHRGTQYSRAIKHYMKKFNRYPTRIEDLESTNNIRYLRKRYKDPITGKDFKLLHQGEVQMSSAPGLAGANSVASLAGGAGAPGGAFGGGNTPFGGSGVFGGGSPGNSGGIAGSGFGGNSGGGFGGNSGGGFGSNSGNAFGGNSGGPFGGNAGGTFGGNPGQPANNNPDSASDPNQPQGAPGASDGQSGFGQRVQQLPGFASQENGNGNQVIGGGPVVGVASISKDKSIRSFNKKDHYKDWQFIYDPTTDRGGLITTPYQPSLVTGAQGLPGTPGGGVTPGVNGAPGTQTSPFGFGGQPNAPGGFGTAPQPPMTPQMPPTQAPQ
jgi:type II secretory pathway pseudopilin PulG